jgi:hypothetical protein
LYFLSDTLAFFRALAYSAAWTISSLWFSVSLGLKMTPPVLEKHWLQTITDFVKTWAAEPSPTSKEEALVLTRQYLNELLAKTPALPSKSALEN